MNSLLLTGGRVIDPANRFDAVADVLICAGEDRRRRAGRRGQSARRRRADGRQRAGGLPGAD